MSPPIIFRDEGVWRIGQCQTRALDDTVLVDEFESLCTAALRDRPARFVALDLHGVATVVTRTMSVLLTLQKHQRENGGMLVLCGLEPAVARVFRMTRLDRMYEIFPDVEFLLNHRPMGNPRPAETPPFGP